jgi:hypothetical protein
MSDRMTDATSADATNPEAMHADDLALDGNAAAGDLEAFFGPGATRSNGTCAHCGTRQELGHLTAWVRGPGVVLRCSVCRGVVIRVVRTPATVLLDLHGIARLAIPR